MLALAIVLFIAWALCVLVFKVTVFFVHVLLIIAIIAFVMNFVRGRRTTV